MILVAHDPADPQRPESLDTLQQAAFVADTLKKTGLAVRTIAVPEDLGALAGLLARERPGHIFNLIESWNGGDHKSWLPAAVIEQLRIPHSGASAAALRLCANKQELNSLLAACGVPVPDGWQPGGTGRYIIKSATQHGSFGLEDADILDSPAVPAALARKQQAHGGDWIAERYVEGREFNLSLIEEAGQVRVLPPAEILFEDYPEHKPRIVGYAAKWQEDAFEYHRTPRRFTFPASDTPLLEKLTRLALDCWRIAGLSGYARVDFRVPADGTALVIDINPNPCLAPEAGFMAAAERAGLSPADTLCLLCGLRSGRRPTPPTQIDPAASQQQVRIVSRPPQQADITALAQLVAAVGIFGADEVQTAVELAEERLTEGVASGYAFVFAETAEGRMVGYTCFGPIPLTRNSHDLYWIATAPDWRGRGIARRLLAAVEQEIAGGTLYIETSSRPEYAAARALYGNSGYREAAYFPDFYESGDDKLVYAKTIPAST